MADSMDLAQLREQETRDRHIQNALSRPAVPSAFFCQSCGGDIPAERRAVIPGVQCHLSGNHRIER